MSTSNYELLLANAQQLAKDLDALIRQEQLNGHLSPTDSAVMQRASRFLRHTLAEKLQAPASTQETRT